MHASTPPRATFGTLPTPEALLLPNHQGKPRGLYFLTKPSDDPDPDDPPPASAALRPPSRASPGGPSPDRVL